MSAAGDANEANFRRRLSHGTSHEARPVRACSDVRDSCRVIAGCLPLVRTSPRDTQPVSSHRRAMAFAKAGVPDD